MQEIELGFWKVLWKVIFKWGHFVRNWNQIFILKCDFTCRINYLLHKCSKNNFFCDTWNLSLTLTKELWQYFTMPLISAKLEIFPRAHETKIHQCLPNYIWCKCTFEAHRFGKNQDFEKVKEKHTTQVCWKTSRGYYDTLNQSSNSLCFVLLLNYFLYFIKLARLKNYKIF